MSKILHIETATPVCSVALSEEGFLVASKSINEFNSHSEVLTIFIESVLQEANWQMKDLNAIAVSNGPGSYTGLRIGASVAKGLAYSLNIPIITIDTIKALAYGIESELKENYENPLYCPMIDARRMEVYTAFYDVDFNTELSLQPFIIDDTNLLEYLEKFQVIVGGTGAQKCYEVYQNHENMHIVSELDCSAEYMIPLAHQAFSNKDFADLAYFEPNYLKEFVGK